MMFDELGRARLIPGFRASFSLTARFSAAGRVSTVSDLFYLVQTFPSRRLPDLKVREQKN